MFPPFWKQDSHWPTVVFRRYYELQQDESINIRVEGRFNLSLDGKLQFGQPKSFLVPRGKHELTLKVWNQTTPPSIYIEGATINSDRSWEVSYEDKIWIDEEGTAHDSGIYVPVASWNFNAPDTPPSQFRLPRKEQKPAKAETTSGNAILYDFGRETFGNLKFIGLHGQGTLCIYYGESREEALDHEHCEMLDLCPVCCDTTTTFTTADDGKAFRFVHVVKEGSAGYKELLMDYEYAPYDPQHSGSFCCSDDELNRIWQVSAYTLELTTREFFTDGIKRDRWIWSGDAIQSYLMNFYLHFDTECVKRTIRQLRGKDPVTAHINTIMDYTFYWFLSIWQYLLFTHDTATISELQPSMVRLMDYVLQRTNADGMAEAQPDDWIFVDWTDFPMHKRGALCFEQILLHQSLAFMASISTLFKDSNLARSYLEKAYNLRMLIKKTFWNREKHAFMHALEDGELNTQITRFPNIMAIILDFADEKEKEDIVANVLLNPDVPPITTPYMRFYELEALCQTGHYNYVLKEIKDYWGGMLRQGATTFWEKYNPSDQGAEHYAMYGRPYGKSLCHSWGASPIYLLGKYFLGVSPAINGYQTYTVRPRLAGLKWMKGDVPTPFGKIHVEMDTHHVSVYSDGGTGTLYVGDLVVEIPPKKTITLEL